MVDIERKVVVREFDEERDVNVVGKLERNCEINETKKGVSIFTNVMGDPLSRIRFYPLHVMLVAELLENGELVGVVRGCIKTVRTHSGSLLKMGCILGLRVSPTYRRKGVGLKLVRSVEEWMVRNGAEYSLVATEKNNEASTKLFTLKSNYLSLSSLLIFVHPTTFTFPHNTNHTTKDIKIHKLNTAQAISLYTATSKHRHLYLSDMDLILKDSLSLGTWVCYYKDQPWDNTINNIPSPRASNWIMFSIWNTCEAYKLQARNKSHHGPLIRFLTHMTLNQAREKMFPCLRARVSDALSRPLGFLFMYGLHGEGDSHSLGELMECVWKFTSRLGASVKDCKVIITELGFDDPLAKLVPQTPCMSCIHDLWYIKRISDPNNIDEKEDEVIMMIKGQTVRNVFVDPRDF